MTKWPFLGATLVRNNRGRAARLAPLSRAEIQVHQLTKLVNYSLDIDL